MLNKIIDFLIKIKIFYELPAETTEGPGNRHTT